LNDALEGNSADKRTLGERMEDWVVEAWQEAVDFRVKQIMDERSLFLVFRLLWVGCWASGLEYSSWGLSSLLFSQ
jgi:hypothetical protein